MAQVHAPFKAQKAKSLIKRLMMADMKLLDFRVPKNWKGACWVQEILKTSKNAKYHF